MSIIEKFSTVPSFEEFISLNMYQWYVNKVAVILCAFVYYLYQIAISGVIVVLCKL